MKEEKEEQNVVTNPVTETEISDEKLDKVNGGVATHCCDKSDREYSKENFAGRCL